MAKPENKPSTETKPPEPKPASDGPPSTESVESKGPKLRKLRKELASFIPFVKWHPGLVLYGEITRKFENSSEFGVKQNLEIRAGDVISYTDKEGEVHDVPEGELINVGQTAGLNTAMTLEVGTTVQIHCTGKKDLGRGRKPAWEFDVTYE